MKKQLPRNEEEAEARYNKYKSIDPFPNIKPALLNSADIFRYVAATGMIYPFDPLPQTKFRGATYAVSLNGKCLYWDDKGEKQIKYVEKGRDGSIILKPNSITFVTLEPFFRIPEYMILRFNLRIDHVYKGLLLGTGPIVDPGFTGKLSLPLHNLTINKYILKLDDRIIWVEFTKLSEYEGWYKNKIEDKELPYLNNHYIKNYYVKYEGKKTDKDVENYIEDALSKGDLYVEGEEVYDKKKLVRNAVPEEIRGIKEVSKNAEKSAEGANKSAADANKSVKEAKKKIKDLTNKYRNWSFIAILGVAITLAGVIISVYSLVQNATKYITDSKNVYQTNIEQLQEEIQVLRSERQELKSQIMKLQQDLEKLLSEDTANKENSKPNANVR